MCCRCLGSVWWCGWCVFFGVLGGCEVLVCSVVSCVCRLVLFLVSVLVNSSCCCVVIVLFLVLNV